MGGDHEHAIGQARYNRDRHQRRQHRFADEPYRFSVARPARQHDSDAGDDETDPDKKILQLLSSQSLQIRQRRLRLVAIMMPYAARF